MRNDDRIVSAAGNLIYTLKEHFVSLTKTIETQSKSYLFQKEQIEKLTAENRMLRKRILNEQDLQTEMKRIVRLLPTLAKMPEKTLSIVQTVSYVKLNRFSQILLTKPKGLRENKLYGLVQENAAAGVARLYRGQLYGYLVSDEACKFAVYIGKAQAPGIAVGYRANNMQVKFIPKWYDIRPGDRVYTSGLDNIFFKGLPVGKVTEVNTRSAYKVALIRTYADIYHPEAFLLIHDASPTWTEGFDRNDTNLTCLVSRPHRKDTNLSNSVESNITSREDANRSETARTSAVVSSKTFMPSSETNRTTIEETPRDRTASAPTDVRKNGRIEKPVGGGSPEFDEIVPVEENTKIRETTSESVDQTREDVVTPEPPNEKETIHRKTHTHTKPKRHAPISDTDLDLF